MCPWLGGVEAGGQGAVGGGRGFSPLGGSLLGIHRPQSFVGRYNC
jgi:hypothetical protein